VTDADTNLAIIRSQNDALNRGDIAAPVAVYAEDCTNHGRPAGRQHLGISQLPIMGGLLVGVAPTGRSCRVQHIH
jgi:hypothetical protein